MSTHRPGLPVRPVEIFQAGVVWFPGSAKGLQILDIQGFYGQWWALIDFLLLLTVFTGIAHATIGRKLDGPGGQLATMGIGAALALGGLGFEWTAGATLASLAPVAAAVFLVVLGVAAFSLFRSLGFGVAGAGIAALVLLAFAVSAAVPAFAGWAAGVVQLIALGGCVYGVASVLFGKGSPSGGNALAAEAGVIAGHQTEDERERRQWSANENRVLKDEKFGIASALRPVTKQAEKSTDRILKELYLVKKVLARGPPSAKDREAIASALSRITPERTELSRALDQVRQLEQRLRATDEGNAGNLTGGAKPVTVKQQSATYRISQEEREKIDVEKKIEYVQTFIEKYDSEAGVCLKNAADQLVRGDVPTAMRWLDTAIAREEEAAKMIRRARVLEKMLLRLTKYQLRQLRDAA